MSDERAEAALVELGRLRAAARLPFRTLEIAPPPPHPTTVPIGSGIVNLPSRFVPEIELPGAPGTPIQFHSSCDAAAGTTASWGDGPQANEMSILCVFWGSIWNTPLNPGADDIYNAIAKLSVPVFNTYGSYSYFDLLGPGYRLTPADPIVVVTSSSVTIPTIFQQSDIEAAMRAIRSSLTGSDLAVENYVIFLPPGLSNPNAVGAHSFYHDPGDTSVIYTWVSYQSSLAALTYTFSHEMVEAMTDPFGNSLQINPRNPTQWNEICDVCCSSAIYNGVTVAAYFVPSIGACCVPAPPANAFPPGDYQIDMVRKAWSRSSDDQFIVSVSGPDVNGQRWVLGEADVVDLIRYGNCTFYTSAGGHRATVGIEKWYLKTNPDGYAPNNLDNLPAF